MIVIVNGAQSQSRTESVRQRSTSRTIASPVTNHALSSGPCAFTTKTPTAAGVVYYANYLKFPERARTEWLRALGFEQTDLAARHDVVFVVRSLAIEYARPARFNDELRVTVELTEVRRGQIAAGAARARGDEELARASVRIACVNTASFRPVRIPGGVAAALSRVARQE